MPEARAQLLDLERAAALDDAVEHAVHEAGVEQMALHLDEPLTDAGRRARHRHERRVQQVEHETLGRAACEQELVDGTDHDVEAPVRQHRAQRRAREAGDDGVVEHHRIAGEVERVGTVDGEALRRRHARRDRVERALIEGVGMVEHAPARQRTEAGVEVIEALVDEPKRHDLDVEQLGQLAIRLERGADTVAAPQKRLARLEERVTLAFERPAAREVGDAPTLRLEPGAVVR